MKWLVLVPFALALAALVLGGALWSCESVRREVGPGEMDETKGDV